MPSHKLNKFIMFTYWNSIYKDNLIDEIISEEGDDFIFRCVGNPLMFKIHPITRTVLVFCSLSECKLCKSSNDLTVNGWILPIIYKDELKVFVFGTNIYKCLQDVVKVVGDPTMYDIHLVNTNKIWSGIALNKTPLTDDHLKIKESIDEKELKKLIAPLPQDKIDILLTFS